MAERQKLLESIAATTADYRKGELAAPTPAHVDRWVRQFDESVQLPMLGELDHVLKQTYFSKDIISQWFSRQIQHEGLAGKSPCDFWNSANFLSIQKNGRSQAEILALFSESLSNQCGISVGDCGAEGDVFVYLDDVLFSGGRVGADLKSWVVDSAPRAATVHVLVIATHRLGEWQCTEGLKKVATKVGKKIEFKVWAAFRLENRLKYRNQSEVLWPAAIPDDDRLNAYLAEQKKFPFQPRVPGDKTEHEIFSSEGGRQIMEQELLLAGIRIRAGCADPKPSMRPLGFSAFGLGFGSTVVTYRNCPNNCPLALWWGDPDATSGPFHWYPFFSRKTYAQSFDFDAIEL